jgi:DNA repair exonuclease SbcCD ATPase subunit
MTKQGSEAARRLASLRRVYRKVCPVCGTEFEGIAKRIYDRPACQVQAYRLRKKERSARRMDLD